VTVTAQRLFEGFFDKGGEDALVSAVREVEAASSAEIVVSVRRSSGSYRDASLIVGIATALGALALGLFSPWPFSLRSLLVDPVLLGALAAWGAGYVPPLRRLATSPAERRRRVEVHARANFVERGVGATTGRTGVLIYVSLLERAACLVPDSGVSSRVPAAEWARLADTLDEAARRTKASAVANAISALSATLGKYLPRSDDDVNELPDEVSAS
jgi:putative membrane protein